MSSGLKIHNSWTLAENAFYLSMSRWERWEDKFRLPPEDRETINLMFSKCEQVLREREVSKQAWKTYNDIFRAIQVFLDESVRRSFV